MGVSKRIQQEVLIPLRNYLSRVKLPPASHADSLVKTSTGGDIGQRTRNAMIILIQHRLLKITPPTSNPAAFYASSPKDVMPSGDPHHPVTAAPRTLAARSLNSFALSPWGSS